MATTLRTTQMVQLQSFWNLIQTIDEGVQKELFVLMKRKYAEKQKAREENDVSSFLQMQGILDGKGSEESDRLMLDDYLKEKYGV